MEAIDFATPTTVEEAVQLMASKGNRARMMAGGTDILVQMRAGRRSLDLVVDAKGIPELNELSYDAPGGPDARRRGTLLPYLPEPGGGRRLPRPY